MSFSLFHSLAVAARVVGAVSVVTLLVVAIVSFRQARSGAYYVMREAARRRGLRAILIAVSLVPVTVGLAAYVDYLADHSIAVVSATETPTSTATRLRPTSTTTFTAELPTDTPLPRPTATPLPVPTATPSPTRIPPTDLPPTLLTPIPSAVPAAENASFGPIQLGSGYLRESSQLTGVSNVFPLDTPIVHATFLVRNVNRNAVWAAAWYRDGKYIAGDPLLWMDLPNIIGHAFFGQPGGFRPGKWELRLYIEDRLQSKATFTILNATSTPTITPTFTPTAEVTPPG
jgi:putative effector of murein hydrolase LrgA (UPF0299 family)